MTESSAVPWARILMWSSTTACWHPFSAVRPLAQVKEAARLVQRDEHPGKVGVLCLAPRPGLGVTGPERRVATLDPRRHKPFAAGRQAAP
ncbi:hypothetical protein [Streptomyces tauricus]|uniref:hypothetical protein n=1 Tax=Streptomyces tauricus TaxID=68274 RepID=UPI003F4B8D2C